MLQQDGHFGVLLQLHKILHVGVSLWQLVLVEKAAEHTLNLTRPFGAALSGDKLVHDKHERRQSTAQRPTQNAVLPMCGKERVLE